MTYIVTESEKDRIVGKSSGKGTCVAKVELSSGKETVKDDWIGAIMLKSFSRCTLH